MAEAASQGLAKHSNVVVIAIDGSEFAHYAFDFYADNLHQPNNELLLIHSGELPTVSAGYPMYSAGDLWEQLLEKEKQKVRELEEKYAEDMKAKGLSGKIKAVFGAKPGEIIVEEAEAANAKMIVVGNRGLGKIRRTIMGSVSDYVVHHSHCPVVVCRK